MLLCICFSTVMSGETALTHSKLGMDKVNKKMTGMSPEKVIVHQNKMAASRDLSRNVTHI